MMGREAGQNKMGGTMRVLVMYAHVSLLAISTVLASPSTAQDVSKMRGPVAQTTSQGATADSQDIVVTGSRIIRNGFKAPTPVSVVSDAEIAAAAPVVISDYLNQLPAFNGSATLSTNTQFLSDGLAGTNLLNLRNLGTNRTLVLLDGRRVPASLLTGEVDINTLPSVLVDRVEIVTGGASATWGSDAVAGVVNFVTDKNFEGIKGKVQGGIASEGDAESIDAEIAYGTSFSDSRVHLTLAANYSRSWEALLRKRDWFRGYKVVPSASSTGPARLILPNTALFLTDGGVVRSGPLFGLQFGPNGQPLPNLFDTGTLFSGGLVVGSSDATDIARGVQVSVPLERSGIFARAGYDVTDSVNLYGEFSYGDSQTSNVGAPSFTLNPTLRIDNAFLPNSVRAQMVTAGVTTLPIAASYFRFGQSEAVSDRTTYRYTVGLSAELGGAWRVGGYVQHGLAKIRNRVTDNFYPARLSQAFDSVISPSTGSLVCRSTLTDPINGCVPINPLGEAPLTAQQAAFVQGTAEGRISLEQDIAAATLQGELYSTPAGPILFAAGAEYRRDKASATSDPDSVARRYLLGNYQPFSGRVSAKEVFGEISVPIFKDSALGTSLELNAAGRITDYSSSGTVKTWKLGAMYQPASDLTFRATRSRDIRAPNLSELYLGGSTNVTSVNDPFNGGRVVTPNRLRAGNPNLGPEVANVLAIGAVYQPRWAPALGFSVDFYNIKISEAIALPSEAQLLNRCFAGDSQSCGLIHRNESGTITQIDVIPINQRSEQARGVDVELSYRNSLASLNSAWNGSFSLRTMITYTDKLVIQGAAGTVGRHGEVGSNLGAALGVPRVRGLVTAAVDSGPVDVQLKGRFISSAKIERDFGPADVNINDVPAILYLDAFMGYEIKVGSGSAQIFASVDNILNTNPPIVANQDGLNVLGFGTSSFIYDTIGRTFRSGVRFKF